MPRKIKLNPSFPAVIYARYSSHAQNDASIEQQIDACTEFAKHYDLTIARTYEDRAVSGRTDKRHGFQKMMQDAQLGAFRYLIAWKSNRMGRNMLEAMTHDAELKELGIRCLYVEEDFDDSLLLRILISLKDTTEYTIDEDISRFGFEVVKWSITGVKRTNCPIIGAENVQRDEPFQLFL